MKNPADIAYERLLRGEGTAKEYAVKASMQDCSKVAKLRPNPDPRSPMDLSNARVTVIIDCPSCEGEKQVWTPGGNVLCGVCLGSGEKNVKVSLEYVVAAFQPQHS